MAILYTSPHPPIRNYKKLIELYKVVSTINKNSSGDEIANVLVNDDIAHT